MSKKLPKVLQSSQDSTVISLTIKSAMVMLAPALMVYAKYTGTSPEVINDLTVVVLSIASTVGVLYGAIRKLKK